MIERFCPTCVARSEVVEWTRGTGHVRAEETLACGHTLADMGTEWCKECGSWSDVADISEETLEPDSQALLVIHLTCEHDLVRAA